MKKRGSQVLPPICGLPSNFSQTVEKSTTIVQIATGKTCRHPAELEFELKSESEPGNEAKAKRIQHLISSLSQA